jgi:hypothetical protein
MRRISFIVAALAVAALAPADSSAQDRGGARGRGNGLDVLGLTADQKLIRFNENAPDRAREIGTVGGLMGGELLVGIDFRPADGRLYGLGNAGGVYVIDPSNATATRQSVLVNAMDMMPVALAGASFGVDFNPVPDRLRVTSDTGQNLRVNVDTGMTNVDGALNPAPGTGITGAAYTNNDADPDTLTVLYDLDTVGDQLSIQSLPNAGTLAPVGKLQVDSGADVGFDIFSEIADGTTRSVTGLATLSVGTSSQLFAMDLTTGRASLRGAFADGTRVIGIAIPLTQGNGNGRDARVTNDESDAGTDQPEPTFVIGGTADDDDALGDDDDDAIDDDDDDAIDDDDDDAIDDDDDDDALDDDDDVDDDDDAVGDDDDEADDDDRRGAIRERIRERINQLRAERRGDDDGRR